MAPEAFSGVTLGALLIKQRGKKMRTASETFAVSITVTEAHIREAVREAVENEAENDTLDEERLDELRDALLGEMGADSYHDFICSHPIDPIDPTEYLTFLMAWM